MRVLAIDTSTSRGSVAVVDNEQVRGEVRLVAPDAHSTRVIGAIDFLLGSLDLRLDAMDGLALAIGPGSFTGLRVGISAIQGLSLGAGLPVAGIVTLDALAHRIRGTADRLVALMDAYRDGVYVGLYDGDAARLEPPRLARPDDLFERLPAGAAFIGEAAVRYREQLAKACLRALFPQRSLFLAGTVGTLALAMLAAGQGVPAESVRPLYLREPHIGSTPRT